uniref:LRRCT domain-containing protein n=1 Tax=Buteo japonicus TaxID=224669 RepID=A0A8C0BZU0_9AVES
MPLIAVVWQPGATAPVSVLLCAPAWAVPSPACSQPSSPLLLCLAATLGAGWPLPRWPFPGRKQHPSLAAALGAGKSQGLSPPPLFLLQLGDASFGNASLLIGLRIEKNNLSRISPGAFQHLPDLRYLSLASNKLQELPLPCCLFDTMPHLRELDLGRNSLATLPDGIFVNLTSLGKLILSHNQLAALPRGAFTGLSKLLDLQLDTNQLSALDDEVFASLPNLKTLNLRKNQLESVPRGLLDPLKKLSSVYLSGNPWRCDCNLCYLHSWILGNSEKVKLSTQVSCKSPPHLAGQAVTSLRDDHLTCQATLPLSASFTPSLPFTSTSSQGISMLLSPGALPTAAPTTLSLAAFPIMALPTKLSPVATSAMTPTETSITTSSSTNVPKTSITTLSSTMLPKTSITMTSTVLPKASITTPSSSVLPETSITTPSPVVLSEASITTLSPTVPSETSITTPSPAVPPETSITTPSPAVPPETSITTLSPVVPLEVSITTPSPSVVRSGLLPASPPHPRRVPAGCEQPLGKEIPRPPAPRPSFFPASHYGMCRCPRIHRNTLTSPSLFLPSLLTDIKASAASLPCTEGLERGVFSTQGFSHPDLLRGFLWLAGARGSPVSAGRQGPV